jgi:predicted nucleic acid-binding protein
MSDYVLDASVLIKWAVPENNEKDTGKAIKLLIAFQRGDIGVVQPVHWLCEVAAVLCRISKPTAGHKVDLLRALEIPVLDTPAVFQTACDLAIRLEHHLFDTLYHAVALQTGAMLITADAHYYRKAKDQGHIELLTDQIE